jgi:hypothetical protein
MDDAIKGKEKYNKREVYNNGKTFGEFRRK